jgi:hypothetical protein
MVQLIVGRSGNGGDLRNHLPLCVRPRVALIARPGYLRIDGRRSYNKICCTWSTDARLSCRARRNTASVRNVGQVCAKRCRNCPSLPAMRSGVRVATDHHSYAGFLRSTRSNIGNLSRFDQIVSTFFNYYLICQGTKGYAVPPRFP